MVDFKHIIRKGITRARLFLTAAAAILIFNQFVWYPLHAGAAEESAQGVQSAAAAENLRLKDRLYEIEAMINKKHGEIEQVKESIDSGKNARRIKDDEYQSARKRLDESEKKGRGLYDEKARLSKSLKLNTDNLLRKKSLLNDRIRAAYKNSFRKKMGYVIKSESFVDFYVNLNYLTRIIKFDTEFISDIIKKVALVKKQREELDIKLKELDLAKNNAAECEKSLKRASDRMGSDISGLYERELALKQELAVLYLEKERVEKQIVEDAPAAKEETKVPLTAAAPETTETQLAGTDAQKPPEAAVNISSLAFAWPLKSSKSVLSFYGTQKDPKYNVSYFNSGIDITGAYGEEVVASADGKVKYKGEMKSVGKLLIIDHGGNITTLYSHLGVIEVGMGQKIGRGETIGRLTEKSESGAEKPLLHFEIRINGGAKDPMDYL
ncbi:MAG TPA: hypothetical protein DC017_10735 [Candidatus Wallbacteria bacterium]|nr:hypothetical protein [Candidatus Wallbacteria bacterium]